MGRRGGDVGVGVFLFMGAEVELVSSVYTRVKRFVYINLLFPSPVKNLWSSQLKSLPQYFYSSKNDGFMKNFLSIPF